MSSKKLIVIAGPTASGKTALGVQLAKYFNTEIISADSRQCYKELNIAVAKPSHFELNEVKHHFINSHSIHENMNAQLFCDYAQQALKAIFSKNNIAICVGGTGLYLSAFINGFDEMPSIDEQIKMEVQKEFDSKGLSFLQDELSKYDPDFLKSTDAYNPMRLFRALVFYKSNKHSILQYLKNKKTAKDYETYLYAIDIDRELLYQRINNRVEEMLHAGLLQEAMNLKPYQKLQALQTVGYKELFDYFNGQCTLDFAIEKIKQHTRNYAKRQITWFKHQADYQFLKAEEIISKLTNS